MFGFKLPVEVRLTIAGVNIIYRKRVKKSLYKVQMLQQSVRFDMGKRVVYVFKPDTFWNLKSITDIKGRITVKTIT